MNTQLITILGTDGVSLTATEAAFEKRDTLALACGTVTTVKNAVQAEQAAALLKEIKGFTRLIEDSRKEVKEPIIALGKQIDGLAKELTEFLEQDGARISKLLGNFQMEQARLVREAQEKAYQEEQRILREAEERKRVADETSRSQAIADRRIDKIEAQTFEAVAQVRANAASVAVASKPSGIATRNVVKFEVTDIHALYAARPELVKMEANTAVINAVLRSNPRASIPGLRTWEEASAIVR
jgi:hypothetical protein